MARNRVHIEASRDDVFAVLADAERYPDWVVGAAEVERHDDEFPAVGSRFRTTPRSSTSTHRGGSG
jgi:uncharacterized protein YndB with AHSA1/START domain